MAATTSEGDPRRWRGLAVLLLATAMGMLDVFIVNVAAPSIQRDLDTSFAALQLVLAGYTAAYAAALVTGGRLGDRYGRRRVFMIGVAVFTLASLGCGLAPNTGALVALRVAQGLAAALMLPQVLSVTQVAFDDAERPRALGLYAATIGLASIAGQIVGGALIAADVAGLGWRAVFFVNVPIGAVALLAAPRAVPESRSPQTGPFDVIGVVLLSVALAALLLVLVEGAATGWPAWVAVSGGAAVAATVAFALWERGLASRGGAPVVPPHIVRRGSFGLGAACVLTFYSGNAGLFLILAYHLQDGLGLTAIASGTVFLGLGAGFAAASLVAGRAATRWGVRSLLAGTAAMAGGLLAAAAASQTVAASGQPVALVAPLLLCGAGQGLIAAPLIAFVLRGTPADDAGAGSGVLLTATQVANALGVAVLGVLFAAALGHRPGGSTAAAESGDAFAVSLAVLVGLAAATALLLAAIARRA